MSILQKGQLSLFDFLKEDSVSASKAEESTEEDTSESGTGAVFRGLKYRGGETQNRRICDIAVRRVYTKSGAVRYVVKTGGYRFGYSSVERLCADWGISQKELLGRFY